MFGPGQLLVLLHEQPNVASVMLKCNRCAGKLGNSQDLCKSVKSVLSCPVP